MERLVIIIIVLCGVNYSEEVDVSNCTTQFAAGCQTMVNSLKGCYYRQFGPVDCTPFFYRDVINKLCKNVIDPNKSEDGCVVAKHGGGHGCVWDTLTEQSRDLMNTINWCRDNNQEIPTYKFDIIHFRKVVFEDLTEYVAKGKGGRHNVGLPYMGR